MHRLEFNIQCEEKVYVEKVMKILSGGKSTIVYYSVLDVTWATAVSFS